METRYETGEAVVFDHIDPPGDMWTGSGRRRAFRQVAFREAFAANPAVHVSIKMIDGSTEANLRIDICVPEVTATGFTVAAKTWSDTQIGRLAISWLAIGPARADEDERWDV